MKPRIGWLGLLAGLAMLTALPQTSQAETIQLDVKPANPVMLAGKKTTNYVRLTLTGFDVPATDDAPPVNVALCIDTSGSMAGNKIKRAREAAIGAVERLRPEDIVSVVLYSKTASTLVPATKVGDGKDIVAKIRTIKSGGNTALFAGVSRSAAEVRKFKEDDSVNRVILLSDGKANVGPSSPADLQRLGASLVKEGISVSTLGLGTGYNEDLMTGLALASSGNHVFIEDADSLVGIFDEEFRDLMSVVAGDFKIRATTAEGVRPVKVLGTEADIAGNDIQIPLAQLYAGQERYFVLELEVPEGEVDATQSLVTVEVQYQNMIDETAQSLTSEAKVKFAKSEDIVKKEKDFETWAYCSIQIANENNRRATLLRDAGKIDEAQKLLKWNVDEILKPNIVMCESRGITGPLEDLKCSSSNNESQSELVKEGDWTSNRKLFRAVQNKVQQQQKSKATDR